MHSYYDRKHVLELGHDRYIPQRLIRRAAHMVLRPDVDERRSKGRMAADHKPFRICAARTAVYTVRTSRHVSTSATPNTGSKR